MQRILKEIQDEGIAEAEFLSSAVNDRERLCFALGWAQGATAALVASVKPEDVEERDLFLSLSEEEQEKWFETQVRRRARVLSREVRDFREAWSND